MVFGVFFKKLISGGEENLKLFDGRFAFKMSNTPMSVCGYFQGISQLFLISRKGSVNQRRLLPIHFNL